MPFTLRISLEQAELERLKLLADANRTSIKAMVEDYLSSLLKARNKGISAEKLTGCLSDLGKRSDDELKAEYLSGKQRV